MYFVLDLILIAVMLVSLFLGYKRGFVKSLLGAVSFVAAVLAALLLSAPVAGFLQDHVVYPAVYKTVDSSLEQFGGGEELLTLLEDSSSLICETLDRFGVSKEEAVHYADSAIAKENDGKKETVREGFVRMIAEPVAGAVSMEIAFTSIFLAVLLLFFVLQIVLDIAAKFPGLHEINQFFGLLFGLVSGVITVCVLVSAISHLWPLLEGINPSVFPADAVQRSVLFRFTADHNLLTLILDTML